MASNIAAQSCSSPDAGKPYSSSALWTWLTSGQSDLSMTQRVFTGAVYSPSILEGGSLVPSVSPLSVVLGPSDISREVLTGPVASPWWLMTIFGTNSSVPLWYHVLLPSVPPYLCLHKTFLNGNEPLALLVPTLILI